MNNLSDEEIEKAVLNYSDMLFRLCFTMLKSRQDAEDAVSDVFVKYISKNHDFACEEHKKAWLIRVAANRCRDMLKFYRLRRHADIDEAAMYCKEENELDILTELLSLPEKYRTIIHLHYIEGYKCTEISKMLGISAAAVRKRLQYGRDMLKIEYERDEL